MRLTICALALLLPACKGSSAEAPDPTAAELQADQGLLDEREEMAENHLENDDADDAPAPIPDDRPAQTIYRSELVRVTNFGPAYLLRELGPEPFRHKGRFVGWEITRVFPDDPGLCAPGCDLQVGDVVLSVNGSPLETPQQLSDQFNKVPELRKLTVVSLRELQRRQISYTIVEDL